MKSEVVKGARLKLAIFVIAFVLTQIAINVVSPLLDPAVPYPGIVSLELARFKGEERASTILAQWDRDGRIEIARWNVWFDYVFIICYVTVMFLACRWSALEFTFGCPNVGSARRWLLWLLAPAQLVAGACDASENVFLLLMLRDGARGNCYAEAACAFATVKFVLLTAGLIFVTAAVVRALARATADRGRPNRALQQTGHTTEGLLYDTDHSA